MDIKLVVATLSFAVLAASFATIVGVIHRVRTKQLSPQALQILPGKHPITNALAYVVCIFGVLVFGSFVVAYLLS